MNELNSTLAGVATPPLGNLVDLHYYVFGFGFGVSTLSSFLRLYERRRSHTLGRDDLWLSFSWFFSTVMQLLMIVAICMKTMCYRRKDIPDDRFEVYVKLSYNAAPAFMMSIGCAKVSILCFYLRTFPDQRFQNIAKIIRGVVIAAAFTITLLLYLSRLKSLSLDDVALFLATAASNIVMDVVLLVLPIPTVFGTQMKLKKKLVVTAFFSLGLVTTITSILRLDRLNQIRGSSDLTWDAAPANITSFLEVNFHLICACMPAVYKFIKETKCVKSNLTRSTYSSQDPYLQPPTKGSSQVRLHELHDADMELGSIAPRDQSSGAGSSWSEQGPEKMV